MQVNLEIAKKLGLSTSEFDLIQKKIQRKPNFTELCMFSAMWSEHCSYKNSKKLLKKLYSKSDRLLAKPGEENAGALKLNDNLAIVFKIESHNHPSALEPYQGAATGVGGIMRDIFTMGARPIATLNSLRFGYPNKEKNQYLIKEVIRGIGDYANSLGIACIGGEIFYHDSFTKNPLVNAMSIGIVNTQKLASSKAKGVGNLVVYVGAKTGKDGVHGASFASKNLSEESESERSAVQVGDPFMEKLLLEATLECIEKDLVVAIQDMGAAGLLSSSSEMSASGSVGMKLNLDHIPIRDNSMEPFEYLLSESQERMLLVISPSKLNDIHKIYSKWKLDATVIGEIIEGEELQIYFKEELIANLPPKILSKEAPEYTREIIKPRNHYHQDYVNKNDFNILEKIFNSKESSLNKNKLLQAFFSKIIDNPNFQDKNFIYEQYDTEIGLNQIIGPGQNAGVFRILNTQLSLVASVDGNSHYISIDPYLGAMHTVAEGFRNVVSAGAEPIGITNCLNFGNPHIPENYYYFQQAVKGMSDAAEFFKVPIISGNVSFYNESSDGPVLPTPTIGTVGIIENAKLKPVSIVPKLSNALYLVGNFQPMLKSSLVRYIVDAKVGDLPALNLESEINLKHMLHSVNNTITSCIDVSFGGLLMTLHRILKSSHKYYDNHELGFEFAEDSLKQLKDMYHLSYDEVLLGETGSTYIIGIEHKEQHKLEQACKNFANISCVYLGHLTNKPSIAFNQELLLKL